MFYLYNIAAILKYKYAIGLCDDSLLRKMYKDKITFCILLHEFS